ncbi:hypothetical protein H2248_003742 [Termitomyces sp. 'cryptogamus']|nr:hypothetical protein H2248_003742 [Termitomyces sp. 'cryptogamus']
MASLHFCMECNNLLYPKADNRRTMLYACRMCQYEENVQNKCVYRNDLLTVTKEQVGVTTDLGSDPTLAHSNISCPRCGNEEHVIVPRSKTRHLTTSFVQCRILSGSVKTERDPHDIVLRLHKM